MPSSASTIRRFDSAVLNISEILITHFVFHPGHGLVQAAEREGSEDAVKGFDLSPVRVQERHRRNRFGADLKDGLLEPAC